MDDLRKAAEQALEALEEIGVEWGFTPERTVPNRTKAIQALRQALAQPEQEPVAWMGVDSYGNVTKFRTNEFGGGIPLYTAPPKRKPLSSEEIEQCCYEADSVADDHCQTWKWTEAFARAIEARLKEKNNA